MVLASDNSSSKTRPRPEHSEEKTTVRPSYSVTTGTTIATSKGQEHRNFETAATYLGTQIFSCCLTNASTSCTATHFHFSLGARFFKNQPCVTVPFLHLTPTISHPHLPRDINHLPAYPRTALNMHPQVSLGGAQTARNLHVPRPQMLANFRHRPRV